MIKHVYQDIDGWFSAEEAFTYLIEKTPEDGVFIECGVWKGKSTSFLVVEFANRRKSVNLISVDHFNGSKDELNTNHREAVSNGEFGVKGDFLDNIVGGILGNEEYGAEAQKYVMHYMLPCESKIASEMVKDGSADVIHIDMGHSYEEVLEDIEAWLPKVKPGGILAGDDYSSGWPGVVKAVKEKFSNFTVIGTTWLFHNGVNHDGG